MAIERPLRRRIVEETDRHWRNHVQDAGFTELMTGKEPGHRMADYVDDRTAALLKIGFDTRHEATAKGVLRKRSMGDIWIRSQGMFNPVNIKSGLLDPAGQPNVVSMQKLLDYLFRRWIDSYYLLIVKFSFDPAIAHRVFLVDLLEWMDFAIYDAGPGQIMLREDAFYRAYDAGYEPPSKTIVEKVERLFEMFEQQLRVLFENRTRRLERQRGLLDDFPAAGFVVDQSAMRFLP